MWWVSKQPVESPKLYKLNYILCYCFDVRDPERQHLHYVFNQIVILRSNFLDSQEPYFTYGPRPYIYFGLV